MLLLLERNFCFDVNKTWRTTWCVTCSIINQINCTIFHKHESTSWWLNHIPALRAWRPEPACRPASAWPAGCWSARPVRPTALGSAGHPPHPVPSAWCCCGLRAGPVWPGWQFNRLFKFWINLKAIFLAIFGLFWGWLYRDSSTYLIHTDIG